MSALKKIETTVYLADGAPGLGVRLGPGRQAAER